MHFALENPSLLLEIFSFLESGAPKSNVLSACLTCKNFLRPALGVLWRELLVTEHPTMVIASITKVKSRRFNHNSHNSPSRELYIDLPLVETDLQQMRDYTRRVRRLGWKILAPHDRPSASNIHPALCTSIMAVLRDEALFPNLNRLDLAGYLGSAPSHAYGAASRYLPYLVSPRLNHLSIGISNPRDGVPLDVLGFILDLGKESNAQPRLRRLEYTCSPPSITLTQAISGLQYLEHLELSSPIADVSFIQALSSLQCLKSLTLSLESLHFPRADERHILATFQSLESLTLTSLCGPTYLRRLLNWVRIPQLSTLKFDILANAVLWDRHFAIIPNHFRELQSFTLGSAYAGQGATVKIRWSDCVALLRLRSLAHLSIQRPCIEILTNEDVNQMVKAWPKLQQLSVAVCEGNMELDHTTLDHIVTRLPNLIVLDLPLSLSGPPPSRPYMNRSAMLTAKRAKLRQLTFVIPYQHQSSSSAYTILPPSSDARAIHRLAQYLNDVLPELDCFQVQGNHVDDSHWQAATLCVEFLMCICTTRIRGSSK